jgi:hypothetical protein
MAPPFGRRGTPAFAGLSVRLLRRLSARSLWELSAFQLVLFGSRLDTPDYSWQHVPSQFV